MGRERLTPAQEARVRDEMEARGATGFVAVRDEPYDDHVFVELVGCGELVIEGDGSMDGDAIAAECAR